MNDAELIEAIRQAIEKEMDRSDWAHRPHCQMLQPVPDFLLFHAIFKSFTCNCDAPGLWLKWHEGCLEALSWCESAINNGSPVSPAQDGRDWNERERDEAIAGEARTVILALAKITGIELP